MTRRRTRIRKAGLVMDVNMDALRNEQEDPILTFLQEHPATLTAVIADCLNMPVDLVRQRLRALLREKKVVSNHAPFRAGKVWKATAPRPAEMPGSAKFTRGLVVQVIGGDYKGRVGEIVDIMYAPRPDLFLYQLCFDPTQYMPWKPEDSLVVYYGREGGL